MKIGILTLPFNNNYGGYLQSIALMEVLRQLGHEPVLINRRRTPFTFKHKLKIFALGIRGIFLKKKKHPFFAESETDFYHKGKNLIPFAKQQLKNFTPPIYKSKDLRKYSGEYDAFIVGSDQVWRPIYVPDVEDFFFRFVKDPSKRLISYAASFGSSNPEYNEEQKLICGDLLRRFSAISLREESGIDVLRKFGWDESKAKIVLDPTLLLPKDYYMGLTQNVTNSPQRNIFCYILDCNPTIEDIVKEAEKDFNCPSLWILNEKWKSRNYVMPSIQNWIEKLSCADFVITDSYHGTVFSILFNKPFIVIVNKRRGEDRFETLLGILGLQDRMVSSVAQLSAMKETDINWDEVNNRILIMRKKSIEFILNALS